MFALMAFMGMIYLRTKPGGPLSTAFRLTLVLVGIIGLIVVYVRESRRHNLNRSVEETERMNSLINDRRGRRSAGRLLLVVGIMLAVLVGIIFLARSTLPE
jgi:ABC-type Fe3+ transport system permease subunit